MSFLSANFGPFLLLGLTAFLLCPIQWRRSVLFLLSFGLYASWSWGHTALLLLTIGAVDITGRLMAKARGDRRKRFLLAAGVSSLLALLTVFKCAAWITARWSDFPPSEAIEPAVWLAIPVGLSYYIFKLVGYLLDVYWEKIPAQTNFVSLALYAAFFPQIISGPIQRAEDFFRQTESLNGPTAAQVVSGLQRILLGLFEKVVIADQLAIVVDRLFANPAGFSSAELLVGAYCFAFQLYADFSGLTDLAIGLGLLFGITGPENFNLPYFAPNVQEFWRRWHMSLTSWLVDYLFIPLRMSLRNFGQVGLAVAIFVNMLAVGLWHGPTWTYFAFGSLNGVFMVVSALTLKKRNAALKTHPKLQAVRKWVGPLLTFHLIVLALIFFRAADLSAALSYVSHLTPGIHHTIAATRLHWSIPGLSRNWLLLALGSLAVIEGFAWCKQNGSRLDLFPLLPTAVRWGLYYAMIALVFVSARQTQSFIYGHF